MKKSRVWAGVTAALLATALVGCSLDQPIDEETGNAPSTPRVHYTFEQALPDGGTVLCVWAQESYRSGGLSCDWDGAR